MRKIDENNRKQRKTNKRNTNKRNTKEICRKTICFKYNVLIDSRDGISPHYSLFNKVVFYFFLIHFYVYNNI